MRHSISCLALLGLSACVHVDFGSLLSTQKFNEQIIEAATKIGQDALRRYVDWLQVVAEGQRALASSPQASQMDWFASMLKAQADFTQQFAKMVGGMASFGQQPQS